jgi:hypothetical protein
MRREWGWLERGIGLIDVCLCLKQKAFFPKKKKLLLALPQIALYARQNNHSTAVKKVMLSSCGQKKRT